MPRFLGVLEYECSNRSTTSETVDLFIYLLASFQEIRKQTAQSSGAYRLPEYPARDRDA